MNIASADGATNTIPWFEAPNGPIREARFVQSNGVADGGVHNLFVVTGRSDAGTCNLAQPSFLPAGNPMTVHGGNRNIVFRIHTPIFSATRPSSPPGVPFRFAGASMGQGLADGITQGAAGPDEFRTAPLWGVSQRAFLLHDGRTSDLMAAIEAHSSQGSEANAVIQRFKGLNTVQQQDVLNFLRAL